MGGINDAYSLYNAIKHPGVGTGISGVASANDLYSKASGNAEGFLGSTGGTVLGGLGNVAGIYNAIKNPTAGNVLSGAYDAYKLYGQIQSLYNAATATGTAASSAAGTGAAASGTGAGTGAAAGAGMAAAGLGLTAGLYLAAENNAYSHYNPQQIFDFSSNLLKQAVSDPKYALSNVMDVNGRPFTNAKDAQQFAQMKLDALNKMGPQQYAALHQQYLTKSSGILPGDSPGGSFWNDPLTGVASGVFGGINRINGPGGPTYNDQVSRYANTPSAAAAAYALGDSSQRGALSTVYDPFTSAKDFFSSYNRAGAGTDTQLKRLMASDPATIKAIQQAVADGSYKNMGMTTQTMMGPDQFKSSDASGALAQAAALIQMYNQAHPG